MFHSVGLGSCYGRARSDMYIVLSYELIHGRSGRVLSRSEYSAWQHRWIFFPVRRAHGGLSTMVLWGFKWPDPGMVEYESSFKLSIIISPIDSMMLTSSWRLDSNFRQRRQPISQLIYIWAFTTIL